MPERDLLACQRALREHQRIRGFMDILPTAQLPDTSDLASQRADALRKAVVKKGEMSEKDKLKAKKISQDFEALFTGMMMKSMRASVQQEKPLISGGRGEEIYRTLLDQEYANSAAKIGTFGLGKIVEKEIIKHETAVAKPLIDRHE